MVLKPGQQSSFLASFPPVNPLTTGVEVPHKPYKVGLFPHDCQLFIPSSLGKSLPALNI